MEGIRHISTTLFNCGTHVRPCAEMGTDGLRNKCHMGTEMGTAWEQPHLAWPGHALPSLSQAWERF